MQKVFVTWNAGWYAFYRQGTFGPLDVSNLAKVKFTPQRDFGSGGKCGGSSVFIFGNILYKLLVKGL